MRDTVYFTLPQLGVSIYTVNNHRKNILSKLDANNIMEAIHIVENLGIYL